MEEKTDKEDKKSDKDEKGIKNDEKESNNCKALFVQRLVAFIIDIMIVSFVASLVTSPFIDVKKSNELSERATNIMQEYVNGETNLKTYTLEYIDVSYKIARNNGVLSLVTILFEILYFVVFQIYNCGQTLGKKLMKIKVVSSDGELSMNQMIFRSLIANSILLEIISFGAMVIGIKEIYFYFAAIFGLIQYLVIIISLFMVMYRKDGCAVHDKLAHTNVIRI